MLPRYAGITVGERLLEFYLPPPLPRGCIKEGILVFSGSIERKTAVEVFKAPSLSAYAEILWCPW